jgi:mevalonate kinase
MNQQFYARGKLLLTSEFMILHGAKALAVPLTVGQSLEPVAKEKTGDRTKTGELRWTAQHGHDTWFETTLSLEGLDIIATMNEDKSKNLVHMLRTLLEIKPAFIEQLHTHDVITRLEFDPAFGFGSSSTLTALLAQWAEIDPMQLHFHISKGSGYDVACASAESAILYQVVNEMPVIQSVDFQPGFMDQMWLVYLGHKQDSSESVAAFLNNYEPDQDDIARYSAITVEMLRAQTAEEFGALMHSHEERLSEILDIPVLKQKLFPDLDGYAKSLGAWGGDFALLVSPWEREKLASYLRGKGISTWYAYNELVL